MYVVGITLNAYGNAYTITYYVLMYYLVLGTQLCRINYFVLYGRQITNKAHERSKSVRAVCRQCFELDARQLPSN